jgi:ribose transport system permease protein
MSLIDGAPVILGGAEPPQHESDAPVTRDLPFWANPRFGLAILIVIALVTFSTLDSKFLNVEFVLFPALRTVAILTVVGLAQMVVLSIGHMNLAVGRMASFGAMFMGISFDLLHLPLYVGLLIGLVAGAGIGALTGWIIATTGVNSFVVTLAMDFALLGLIPLVYFALADGAAFVVKPEGMKALRSASFADVCIGSVCGSPAIPTLTLFALVAFAGISYMYAKSRLGRRLLVTGSNLTAAKLSGVPTDRVIITAHMLSGLLAALAGFMAAVSTGSFRASIGDDFMLSSFLGPILGGTALAGGLVSPLGVVLGTILMVVIRTGLNLLGIGLENLNILIGLILLAALSVDRGRRVLSERRVTRL